MLINNSRFQVKGGKKKAKRAALLSDLEPTCISPGSSPPKDKMMASGMWASSPLVRKILNENHMDLKRMIDWWTTVIKFTHIQDSEEGPSMPAIGSGGAVNPIEYLCRAGKPVRDHNRHVLKAMVLNLLIPHGYVKQSILWKRLCHEVENLHFNILNWPEEVPVPDTQFDFYKLDANKVLKLLANFLIN
ncbi:hypothetical protein PAXINDRAFT_11807 [Paxillus involutus ATCC 200175]|uniref:Uncharacterized protein n=1 Tax=Paxillus involutus ATCC 200175 TaxID=664439 RepID=A0A0C9U778_PAXIN|nr:hypothetical protein PAXINDRAFT_11807 [Paxillus involutus ATCC 200175]